MDADLLPPEQFQIMNDTTRSFKVIGDRYLSLFKEELNLSPDARVLEIGSGNGRIARALTQFIEKGSYTGVEIMPDFVDWCTGAYRNYAQFKFQHIDVHNNFYFPAGRYKASEYTFPFQDEQFDFIFLTSVATHLLKADLDRYLSEIRRMLKAGGRCLLTFFIVDSETLELMNQGKSRRMFKAFDEVSFVVSPNRPEAAVAYFRPFIEQLSRRKGFALESIRYGRWRNPEVIKDGFNQDHVVLLRQIE